MYHIPVLLKESIEALNIKPNGVYVDCTFGGGGHSKIILENLGKKGKLYGFDQDIEAQKNILNDQRFTFVRGNFKYIKNFLKYYGEEQVDGILADFGVSSHHFDTQERGFSYRFDGPLDMRMNQKASLSAEQLINTYEEEQLANILYNYGEIKNSRKIAATIVKSRDIKPIQTIYELVEILKPFCHKGKEFKQLAPIFQAIRIEVNNELYAIKKMLSDAVDLIKPNGRIVMISYHSLEDRLVKNFFKYGNFEGLVNKDFYGNIISPLKSVYRKVIVSEDNEKEKNSRARSAKLRVAEKNIN